MFTKNINNYSYSCVESKRCNDNRDANGLVPKSGGSTLNFELISFDIDAAQNGICPKGQIILAGNFCVFYELFIPFFSFCFGRRSYENIKILHNNVCLLFLLSKAR